MHTRASILVINYWKWECERCGHRFVLALARMPDPCHRCGGAWFLKIGESETKEPLEQT